MKTDTVKGFRDIEDASKRIAIRKIIESTFNLYNFKPVETPIIEYEEFVKGDNEKDEAVSDVFTLKDRGKRNLALRYEFTFQLKRLAKNKKLPYKRYQIGPVFRDEPVKGNRWRQFTQCDADIIGADIKDIAEILKITSDIFSQLKIKSSIEINNRKLLNEILEELKVKEKDREQVIRELDKLDKLPEKEIKQALKKYNAAKLLDIFKQPESYFKKYTSYKDIEGLKKIAKDSNIKLTFKPFLARGLSYYNWIVFEVKSDTAKGSLAGGGSYPIDNMQATGISFGLDRLETLANINTSNKKVLIISFNQDKEANRLADEIRNLNIPTEIYYGKPGKALDYANSLNIPLIIFLGEKEIKAKKIKIKNMNTGEEKLIPRSQLGKELEKFD
jgi:histidyl-tRNA synthetase